ncbi:MAG: TraR/DksA C4-type zinc finger protein [Spirochaetia bacterium]|nr:TraR/DksA C4-type zinc finger protein [Spirochaetia bacterium]
MTVNELKELEKQIKESINERKKNIELLQDALKPISPDIAIGRLSRLEALGEKGVREKNLRAQQEKLVKLESTLGRLSDPEFGICAKCGKSIPIERILAVPEAELCVKCA